MRAAKKIRKDFPKYKMEIFYSPEDKAFLVNVPELPGCKTHGATPEEAVRMGIEAIELYLEQLESEGKLAPVPMAERNFSGKILLRTSPVLHRELAFEAEVEHKSLNELIEQKLQK